MKRTFRQSEHLMLDYRERIQVCVSKTMQENGTMDVHRLTELLNMECPDISAEDIAAELVNAIVTLRSNFFRS